MLEEINKLLTDQEMEIKKTKSELRYMLAAINLDPASFHAMIYFIGHFVFFDEHELEFYIGDSQ